MTVRFINNCSQLVNVTIGGERIFIAPNHSVSIETAMEPSLKFIVRCENKCRFYKGKYILNIETTYNCIELNDGVTFVITREKTRISSNVYFERLFVSSDNAKCCVEFYKISDEALIKRLFCRKKMLRFLLVEPLEHLTGLVVVLIILGATLSYVFSWKLATVFFIIAYFSLLMINWLSEKICKTVFKKKFGMNDEKTEFFSFFQNKFITKYYLDPKREPFMGEIEIDKLF